MKYLPMLRNRLFAMASFASLVVAGGVASAPAAFADELSLGQEAAPVALDSNANIPGYQSMNCQADNPPAERESVPPVRGEIPTESRVVPSVPSVVPSVPSEATPPLPALVPPTSSTTTLPAPLVAGMTETPQGPMTPAEGGASLLTPLVAGVTESPHAPGSANSPLAAQTSTLAVPVLAGTDNPAPALARTGQAFQTVSLVAGLTAFAGAWLLVLARRRHEN